MSSFQNSLTEILISGNIAAFDAEYLNPKKSKFDANHKSTLERLKEAAEHLLEILNLENLNLHSTITADSYNSALYGNGEQVYEMLHEVLHSHVKNNLLRKLKHITEDMLLPVLVSTCVNFKRSMENMDVVFKHIDNCLQIKNKKLKVFNLGLKIFVDELLSEEEISRKVKTIILKLIDEHRKGLSPDLNTLKEFNEILLKMNYSDELSLYHSTFEDLYLKETEEYYRKVAAENIAKMTSYGYLVKFEKILQAELQRFGYCAAEETIGKTKKIFKNVFVIEQLQNILYNENLGLVALLQQEKMNEAVRICKTLNKITSSQTDGALSFLSSYLVSQGKKILETSNKKTFDERFVELIKLKKTINTLIKKAFRKVYFAMKAIDNEFSKLWNGKQVIQSLSGFLDRILQNKVTINGQNQLDKNIEDFFQIFKFVENKEFFTRVYHHHFSKRLVDPNCSVDSEKMVVKKLKKEFGEEFTRRLEQMFKEFEFSTILNNNFSSVYKCHFEIKINVFSSFTWPIKNTNPINMPQVIVQSFKQFNNIYNNYYPEKRHLMINNCCSSAELAFLTPGKEDKILLVDNFQMTVLMLFNTNHLWTVKDVVNETNIPIKTLINVFQSLAFGENGTNVLLKLTAGKKIAAEDIFTINENFKNRHRKIKLPIVAQHEEAQKEEKKIVKSHQFCCKEAIKAAIARIMKRNKSLDHSILVSEVVEHLKGKFKPEVKEINDAVENLIKRDYIERDLEDSNKYVYIP